MHLLLNVKYETINNLASTNRVDLIWAPVHSIIIGYEKTDELAKREALTLPLGPKPILQSRLSHN